MTVTAQGLSPQLMPTLGVGSQPGSFNPAFPAPIGAEQFLGVPQAQGFQPSIWPQPASAWQMPYGMPAPPFGQLHWAPAQSGYGYAPFGFAQPGIGFAQPGIGFAQPQQLIGQLFGLILPMAQQVILPQIAAMTVPLVQQLVTQLAALQFSGPQFIGPASWAQPMASPSIPGIRQPAGLY
jgi:hypothetical protein